ncbi:hypothetical protein QQ008_17370 [Fulvivirgaceae bacterium BMA10]|uniref:Tetratricopeptide repeat protein n=1 Tax=Splendidivirga corallicola TaxID=3051826 RepID=A0ABT8KU56_9BACT|nr:hypothetical protein [Fulvivirgaceae bacterium BMA10]
MKKNILIILAIFLALSCEEIDPTRDINNPNLLLENVIGSPGSVNSWIVGQERQMAIVYNQVLELTELGSDNYVNVQTFFNQQFDRLNITFQDADVNTIAFRIADLRESGKIGLNDVFPADPTATPEQEAQLQFYVGWAKLLAGELFVALPDEGAGAPLSPTENLNNAVSDFLAAEAIDGNNPSYKLALARAYHRLGDQANAVTKAQEAIALDPTFTRTVEFDGTNLPDNDFADGLFQRGNFDDYQPLPRLDFLDPKYFVVGDEESPVYIQKIEEAYLIIAEGQLADGDLAGAQTTMNILLNVVAARGMAMLDDAVENRNERPTGTSVTVRASAADAFKADLVLDRQSGEIPVFTISGTSVVSGDVTALTTVTGALELLYLMRQEIFIAEGRRFVDLGIRIPISENEMLTNSNVTDSDLQAFVPSFVPTDMDAFTFDAGTNEVTITHNMNAVLVANRTDANVVPFF